MIEIINYLIDISSIKTLKNKYEIQIESTSIIWLLIQIENNFSGEGKWINNDTHSDLVPSSTSRLWYLKK
jgi:hypothetical protein